MKKHNTMKKLICLLTVLLPFIAYGQYLPADKLITVIGTAHLEIEPDWVVLQMSAKDIDNTKNESDIVKMENTILKFIAGLGMEPSSFMIEKFSANTKYNSSASTKFRIQKSYELRINNVSLLDTIISGCFDAGMDNLYVGEIGHSKIDSIRDVVLKLSLDNAKNKAKLIAESMGIEKLKVASVNESYKVVNNETGRGADDYFYIEEIVSTGYGVNNKTRIGSSLNLQKIEVNKTVIVKYDFE